MTTSIAQRRKALLGIVGDSSKPEAFASTVLSSKGSVNTEFFDALPRKQAVAFWTGLRPKFEFAAEQIQQSISETDNENCPPQEELSKHIQFCRATNEMVIAAIGTSKPRVDDSMVVIAVGLQELLFLLPSTETKLKNKIAVMCETWWKKDLPERDQLIPQTIAYLLMKSLEPEATARDVKRVYSFKDSLMQLDFADDSSEMLKAVLLQCVVNPTYLSVPEGLRFLSFLFCLSLDMIEIVHDTIKSTLPFCPKKYVEEYGNVYFRAWRSATNAYLEKIEKFCIQDLMDRGTHARRDGGSRSMATTIRTVLNAFHDKKSERGVDETLTKLYQPILWRALKAPNPMVRSNACSLLACAFPLRDSSANRSENEELMQLQFDSFSELLVDDFPMVRATAVEAVFRVACIYWELIPKPTLSALLTKIMGSLSRDASSSLVRVTVCKGIAYLLGNPLSQPLMNKLLPKMGDLIHDPAEKVRAAFVNVLTTVVSIRGIKFWDIVSVDHLLARLEMDSIVVNKKIVGLLQPSYFPLNKSEAVRVSRCLHMVETQPNASRVFYQHLGDHVSESDIGKFVITIFDTIIDTSNAESDPMLDDNDGDSAIPKASVPPLLDITAVLIGSIAGLLADTDNKRFCKRLMESAAPVFDLVENEYDGHDGAKAAVTQIQCYIPAASKRTKLVQAQLEALEDGAAPAKFKPLVDCMCAWGRTDQILALAHGWLNASFEHTHEDVAAKKKGKVSKSSKLCDAKPRLALGCIDYVLSATVKQNIEFTDRKLHSVIELLAGTKSEIVSRLSNEDNGQQMLVPPEAQLRKAFELYVRGTICSTIARSSSISEVDTGPLLDDIQVVSQWAEEELIVNAKTYQNSSADEKATSKRRSNRKRKVADEASSFTFDVEAYLSTVLTAHIELLKLGIARKESVETTVKFCQALLKAFPTTKTFVGIGKLLCELDSLNSATKSAPFTEFIDDLIVSWLRTASASKESLMSITSPLAVIAKGFQQQKRLTQLISIVAELSLTLSTENCNDALAFFLEYVAKTNPILVAFLNALPRTIERSMETADILDRLLSICSGKEDKIQSVKDHASGILQSIKDEYASAKASESVSIVEQIQPNEVSSCSDDIDPLCEEEKVTPEKETAAQKRAKAVQLSKLTVKITEAKMDMENAVEIEDYPAAAECKTRIEELEAAKAELTGVANRNLDTKKSEELENSASNEPPAKEETIESPPALEKLEEILSHK